MNFMSNWNGLETATMEMDKGMVDDKQPDPTIIASVTVGNDWLEYRWLVARVRPARVVPGRMREDVRAYQALHDAGIPAWYGTVKRRRRGEQAGDEPVRRLAFPGYLMVAQCGDNATLLNCRHIAGLLGTACEGFMVPLCVGRSNMAALFEGEALRERQFKMDSERDQAVMERQNLRENPLSQGESIEVLDSAFGQFNAKVAGFTNANNVRVLLQMLGGSRLVDIPLDKIRRK